MGNTSIAAPGRQRSACRAGQARSGWTAWPWVLVLLLGVSQAPAEVGNPQVRTDHPLYPGELAYSTPERFARSIIDSGDWGLGLGSSERDVALKLWLWKITHTLHDYTPKLWTPLHDYNRAKYKTHTAEHPIRPDPVSPPVLFDEDQDSLRWTFSFGYALCSTQHGNLGPQIEAIGAALGRQWRSRVLNMPEDANHEIYFDGKWRAFDVNAAALLWSSDEAKTAEMLGFQEAFGPRGGPKHPELLDNAPKFNGRYLPKLVWGPAMPDGEPKPFAWMRGLLESPDFHWDGDEVGRKSPRIQLLYHAGYNACPIVYGLKKGETFTRWFSGDDARRELALPRPTWWGANINGGPGSTCYYSHYLRGLGLCEDSDPLVFSEDSQTDGRYAWRDFKEATYGNGLYDWRPNLPAGDWKDGAVAVEGPVEQDDAGIGAAGPASVTFPFFSPYVIAAMPGNQADPALDGATNGAVLEAQAAGEVPVEVSVDNGLVFRPAGTLQGDGRIDFTDAVKGRNQYLLRVRLDKGRRLQRLRLRTMVTTCRAVYPKLRSGTTTVTYAADGLDAFEASPDFTSEPLATARGSFVPEGDMVWIGYDAGGIFAWGSRKDVASCVYQVTSPAGELAGVSAAAQLVWPWPTPEGVWAEIAVSGSPDGPWTTMGRIDPQAEDFIGKNNSPFPWIYGTADLAGKNLKTAYVRVRQAGGGKAIGIRYWYMYGTYEAGNRSPLTITYHWRSGGESRRHTETVAAGDTRHTYTIDTGKAVENVKVVFSVPASK